LSRHDAIKLLSLDSLAQLFSLWFGSYRQMKTRFPAYVVLDIPQPIRSAVSNIRKRLRYPAASLPVEITIAGSSGVGPIPAGYSIPTLVRQLGPIVETHRAFRTRFSGIGSFRDTHNYYLSPEDRTPFDEMHQSVGQSVVGFSPIQWPYTPHCTLRTGNELDLEDKDFLNSLRVPTSAFTLDTLSIYQLDDASLQCDFIHQWQLAT
jgi:2'-5' RNA ligase